MTLPFVLPDWLPWWVPILVLVPVLLYGLALLAMPFAVFGVKARLEAIEFRLDEIQGEIRSLSLRLREPSRDSAAFDDGYVDPPARLARRPPPPIPPAAPEGAAPRQATPRPGRAEPRLNWPR